jgi:L-ascorbate metabolism protein UlaG (beta-lactamase superfamily)
MIFVYLLIVLIVLVIAVYLFMRQSSFGQIATGERLQLIKRSPNYRDGSFQNQHFTPTMTEGVSYSKVMKEFFFDKNPRSKPAKELPSQKINLHTLAADKNVLVWFGHSSYFIQVDGKKILVDPVFSGNASPVKFTTKSYPGSDVYTVNDIPEVDYLFISHDHWDHLDYPTILALQPKIKKIITGLGTAAHFERWGVDMNHINEKDWNEAFELDKGFIVNTLPARHFSGRGFTRNQSLWMSFALTTPTMKLYLGGDSGYDTHFAEIGKNLGPFDLAILECGQYNQNWKYIHMMPEELIQAGIDLQAKKILPVHWAKFTLGQHAWDEPIIRVTAEAKKKNFPVWHPMIGQEVNLSSDTNNFTHWWEAV